MNKYIEQYLNINRKRGLGLGYAINSFVTKYYKRANPQKIQDIYGVFKHIDKEEGVIKFTSIHGRVAYYFDDAETKRNANIFFACKKLSVKFNSVKYFKEIHNKLNESIRRNS